MSIMCREIAILCRLSIHSAHIWWGWSVKIQADGFDWRLVLFGDRIAVKAPSLYLPWASITCSCVTCPSWRLARDFTRRAVPRSPFHTFCSLALATFFFLIAPSFTLSLPPCHGSQSPLGSMVAVIEEPLINLVVDVPASDERRQSHLWMKALIRLCHYLNGFMLQLTLLNGKCASYLLVPLPLASESAQMLLPLSQGYYVRQGYLKGY